MPAMDCWMAKQQLFCSSHSLCSEASHLPVVTLRPAPKISRDSNSEGNGQTEKNEIRHRRCSAQQLYATEVMAIPTPVAGISLPRPHQFGVF
ncbi:hypothetical protein U9M48_032928 [Paspalum notatum var. saurae]|uniref:Uncharacterized protein n=1 Tax=Paspalum notatum var. saurae TaxID=547442 RepID=A0AAQ3UAA0_PASNO